MSMSAFLAGRLVYSTELTVGAQLLRPFHLSWRADFGLSAIIEPDNLVELVELILLNGLLRSNLSFHGGGVDSVPGSPKS